MLSYLLNLQFSMQNFLSNEIKELDGLVAAWLNVSVVRAVALLSVQMGENVAKSLFF